MCGVLGLYNYDSADINDNEFDLFVDSLEHRGPDGRGVYKDKDVFFRLGHRRLSILDLTSSGAQPMSYLNGRYWIAFNGEIYNFLELKKELQKCGYAFKSQSDAEVILASYVHWKEDCQLKFNGMWAFVIWDAKKKELFLSRDRFGVKPLHYYFDEKRLAFASETKSFWHLSQLDLSFDQQMIANTIINANIWASTENTLISGIKSLKAGHCAVFNKDKKLTIKSWWNTFDHLVEVPLSDEDKTQKFKELFFDACHIRMRSDVPLGSALSGGLDSSSVLCAISQISDNDKYRKDRVANDWQRVFTATFPNTSQDEYSFAKKVVQHTNANANYYEINENQAIDNLDKLIYDFEDIFDLPVGPWQIYKEYRKQNCRISIDGHGADELLGGYHHHVEFLMQEAIHNKFNIISFHKMHKILSNLYVSKCPYNYRHALKEFFKNKIKNFKSLYHVCKVLNNKIMNFKKLDSNNDEIQPQDSSTWLSIAPNFFDCNELCEKNSKYNEFDSLTKLLYRDFHYTTLPVILRNFDRSSMAHGVEIRAPFLDWRLVTYIFSLTQKDKINKGFTKLLLRNAMKGILPEDIRIRKNKIGFASPIFEWFGRGLKTFILDSVNSQSFLESNIWKGHKIKNYVENCYDTKNYRGIYSYWLCILANKLMESYSYKKELSYK